MHGKNSVSICNFNLLFAFLLITLLCLSTHAKVNKVGLALMLAVENKNRDDVKQLISNENSNTVNRYSISILHTATANGDESMVKLLLDHNASINYSLDSRAGHREGESSLHFAAAGNKYKIAKILLDHGANPTQLTFGGLTALHLASGLGHYEFIKELKPYLTLEDINMPGNNNFGSQPIHLASTSFNKNVVELLLNMGANANAVNKRGSYPIHGAALVGDVDTAKVLTLAGAKKSKLNGDGLTALEVAEKRMLTADSNDKLITNIDALRLLLSTDKPLDTKKKSSVNSSSSSSSDSNINSNMESNMESNMDEL
jgi:ankyrin repeat protein